jgi:hypothetical protein
MKRFFIKQTVAMIAMAAASCGLVNAQIGDYRGKAFKYEVFGSPQTIPGKLMCAYYDLGGEGIAYHETTPENHGSGRLNPANGTLLNEFRIQESVDISYTKVGIDDTPQNKATPDMGLLYVGWTDPGEWINYTVNVEQTGTYTVNFLCSAAADGAISLSADGKDLAGTLNIPSTTSPHIWTRIDNLATVSLVKGIQVISLFTQKTGGMNYAWFEFILK